MNDDSNTSTNTFEIVKAATRIVSALDAGSETKLGVHRRTTARSIDAALAAGQPLDEAFVARTVWDMTRGTQSRAYESVMPEHGSLISRAAAFKTQPDDLKALVDGGWASGSEDIPTFSRIIDGVEWQMVHGTGKWDVTRPDGQLRHRVVQAPTVDLAIKAIEDVADPVTGKAKQRAEERSARAQPGEDHLYGATRFVANPPASSPIESVTGSATPMTLPGVAELIAEGRLPQLDAATIHAAASFVTEARADADRSGVAPDPSLMAARNAIWEERAVRAEQARLTEGWADEPGREAKEQALRPIAERIVKLTLFANAIDEDDGITPTSRARPVEGGREQFDQLAGPDGVAAPARLYVIMRQAQRKGADAAVNIAAAYCEYADAGVVTHEEAVTALASLVGDGLTKRMRETVQKSGHEASLDAATTRSSGVAANGARSLERGR